MSTNIFHSVVTLPNCKAALRAVVAPAVAGSILWSFITSIHRLFISPCGLSNVLAAISTFIIGLYLLIDAIFVIRSTDAEKDENLRLRAILLEYILSLLWAFTVIAISSDSNNKSLFFAACACTITVFIFGIGNLCRVWNEYFRKDTRNQIVLGLVEVVTAILMMEILRRLVHNSPYVAGVPIFVIIPAAVYFCIIGKHLRPSD